MKKNIQKTMAVLGAAVLAFGAMGCSGNADATTAADTAARIRGYVRQNYQGSQRRNSRFKRIYYHGRIYFYGEICQCPG